MNGAAPRPDVNGPEPDDEPCGSFAGLASQLLQISRSVEGIGRQPKDARFAAIQVAIGEMEHVIGCLEKEAEPKLGRRQ